MAYRVCVGFGYHGFNGYRLLLHLRSDPRNAVLL